MGGFFVSTGMEIAKKALTLYLSKVPTYSAVYGAFATVPILLVWIYVAWVIVLLGATLTAYVPSLLAGLPRRRSGPGWQFQLALEVLQHLDSARALPHKGLTASQLCTALRVDIQRLEPVLETLTTLDWSGQLLEEQGPDDDARFVLLVDPATAAMEPLMQSMLLPMTATTQNLWKNALQPSSTLRSAL
jgi:membrane protein